MQRQCHKEFEKERTNDHSVEFKQCGGQLPANHTPPLQQVMVVATWECDVWEVALRLVAQLAENGGRGVRNNLGTTWYQPRLSAGASLA
jgi:hypothetical protein